MQTNAIVRSLAKFERFHIMENHLGAKSREELHVKLLSVHTRASSNWSTVLPIPGTYTQIHTVRLLLLLLLPLLLHYFSFAIPPSLSVCVCHFVDILFWFFFVFCLVQTKYELVYIFITFEMACSSLLDTIIICIFLSRWLCRWCSNENAFCVSFSLHRLVFISRIKPNRVVC